MSTNEMLWLAGFLFTLGYWTTSVKTELRWWEVMFATLFYLAAWPLMLGVLVGTPRVTAA